jgi:hypothetical protein
MGFEFSYEAQMKFRNNPTVPDAAEERLRVPQALGLLGRQ